MKNLQANSDESRHGFNGLCLCHTRKGGSGQAASEKQGCNEGNDWGAFSQTVSFLHVHVHCSISYQGLIVIYPYVRWYS
jgi:hypothetical protein